MGERRTGLFQRNSAEIVILSGARLVLSAAKEQAQRCFTSFRVASFFNNLFICGGAPFSYLEKSLGNQ
jgi:hypothetical protein